MNTPATTRYALDPAPDGLALAQDLLNTIAVADHPDLLADPAAAAAWVEQAIPAEVKLTAADVQQLRAFRTDLQSVVANTGTPADRKREAPGALSVAAGLVLGVNGVVELRGGGSGAEYVISRVLAGVFVAQQSDVWRRVKACRNERCRVAFYDRSKNNSGVWHSLKTCGNPANLRAYRARNKDLNG